MKRRPWALATAVIFLQLAMALLAARNAGAISAELWGGSSFDMQSFISQELAPSTATEPNPFNVGQLNTDHNWLNFNASRFESLIHFRLTPEQAKIFGFDSVSFFVHPRFYSDTAPFLDRALNHVNTFTWHSRYRGNGWFANTVGTGEWEADPLAAYADLKKGRWWLRIGRQQIEYGGGLLLRTLDVVDSLDFRRNLFIDNTANEWSDALIPEWTAKLTYSIPDFPEWDLTNSSLQTFISPDFEPDYLTAPGTWYSVFPSNTILADQKSIAEARRKLVYGAVFAATFHGFDLTANFYSTPQHLGYEFLTECEGPAARIPTVATPFGPIARGSASAGCIKGTPFVIDPFNGVPLFANRDTLLNFLKGKLPLANPRSLGLIRRSRANPAAVQRTVLGFRGLNPATRLGLINASELALFNPAVDLTVDRAFPRMYVYGGSVSYTLPNSFNFPAGELLSGDILRFEGVYEPDKAFTTPGLSATPIRRGQLGLAVVIEKYARLSPYFPATYFLAQYWYNSVADLFDQLESSQGISHGDHLVAVSVVQNLFENRLILQNAFSADAVGGGGFWLQPGITYLPTSNLQYSVIYNFFTGGNQTLYGRAASFDAVMLTVLYRF